MPAEGINYLPKSHLLSFEEMYRLVNLFSELGVDKVRITGGEPFARKDLIKFIKSISTNTDLKKISLTSNGILISPHLRALRDLGINQINLSLDTLDSENFHKITRRDEFDKVMNSFHEMLELGFEIKINAVIMDGINQSEIASLAQLASKYPVAVRFIEEMPFNGGRSLDSGIRWDHRSILAELQTAFPDISEIPASPNATAQNYTFKGAKGHVGIIAAYSRTFCGSCDRIRITSKGELRTCLYGHNVLSIRDLMRQGLSDSKIKSEIIKVVMQRAKDGFEAEQLRSDSNPAQESMSTIGG